MKFINRKFVWLIFSLIVVSLEANAQEKAFEKPIEKGDPKLAYETLLKIDLFALGGTGYAGQTSDGEKALKILVEEGEASIADLKNLVKDAAPEGGLYALLGLRMLKCDCFEEEVENFLNKPEPGERKIWNGSRKIEAGMVNRMSGCIGFSENRVEAAENIMTGKFDLWIKSEERRRELKKQKN